MSSLTRRAFNNTFWLSISEICAKGGIFLATLYLARVLGVAGFGAFSLAVMVGIYMWTVVDMGVTLYGTREIAKNRENAVEMLKVLNSMRLVMAVISFFILLAVLLIVGIPLETRLVLLAGGFYVVAYALSPDWVLRGVERMEYIALSNAIVAIFFFAAVFLFVNSPADTIEAVIYRTLSFFIGSIVALVVIKKKLSMGFSFEIAMSKWWFHVKESFYFAVNGGLNNIAMYIPIFFLGLWTSMEDIGIFSAPQRIVLLIISAMAVIPAASYPIMSDLYGQDKDKFCRAHKSFERIMLYIGIPAGALGMLLSNDIVTTLYGGLYEASSHVFKVMIWLIPLMFVRANYGRTLASAGFHRFNMFATGSGAFVSAALCAILIPLYRSTGAAISVVAGEIIVLLVMGAMFRSKLYRTNPFDMYFLKIIAASLLVGIAIANLQLPLFLSIIIGAVLYGVISLAVGLIDIETIYDVYKKIAHRKLEVA